MTIKALKGKLSMLPDFLLRPAGIVWTFLEVKLKTKYGLSPQQLNLKKTSQGCMLTRMRKKIELLGI